MANTHYGEIGDVWKHLPLAEVLHIEAPAAYWESHAGSADYALTHSPTRDYGVFHLIEQAACDAAVERSAYCRVLSPMAAAGQPRCPGSPAIALTVLGPAGASFRFCDLDGDSLATIRSRARDMGLPQDRVRTVAGNGLSALSDWLDPAPLQRTLLFIDPYDPFEADARGRCSVDLFCQASLSGAAVLLWYGFDTGQGRRRLWDRLSEGLRGRGLGPDRPGGWCGEIILDAIRDADAPVNPGVLGCGLLCSGLGDASVEACERLGRGLARVYARARLPNGDAGSLAFQRIEL